MLVLISSLRYFE